MHDFGGIRNWDSYAITGTNIPGARHDVGWGDDASAATPGVTNILVDSLSVGIDYYVSISWNDAGGISANGSPRVSFEWVPSHWRDPFNAYEAPCDVAYATSGFNPGWCIFGTTRAFVSGGYYSFYVIRDGLPLSGAQSFTYPVPPSPPVSPPPSGNPPPGSGQKLAAAKNQDGRLGLFYVGGDSAVYYQYQITPGGYWTEEHRIPAYAKGIAATTSRDGRIELFYIGGDNAVYHRYQLAVNSHSWSNEERFTVGALSISAARNGAGRLEVVIIGMNRALYIIQQTAPNSWSSHRRCQGGMNRGAR